MPPPPAGVGGLHVAGFIRAPLFERLQSFSSPIRAGCNAIAFSFFNCRSPDLHCLVLHLLPTGFAGLESYLPDRNIKKAAQKIFYDHRAFDSLDAYLEKHAKGPKAAPPRTMERRRSSTNN
jgi:hypothetical protein